MKIINGKYVVLAVALLILAFGAVGTVVYQGTPIVGVFGENGCAVIGEGAGYYFDASPAQLMILKQAADNGNAVEIIGEQASVRDESYLLLADVQELVASSTIHKCPTCGSEIK